LTRHRGVLLKVIVCLVDLRREHYGYSSARTSSVGDVAG
jgi:hypothetical protein